MSGMVIIGAGHAAGQAAASLRQEKYEGAITIIGDENCPPYQRPPLSKAYLQGEQTLDRVLIRPQKFYDDKNITLKLGVRATAIDKDAKQVTLDNGETIDYDNLIISTGSRPRKLNITGSELPGIHYLRTISDVDAIRAEMGEGKNLVIVGGGYIGLEVASVGIRAGMNVRVLEMESRLSGQDVGFDLPPNADDEVPYVAPVAYLESKSRDPEMELESSNWTEHNNTLLYAGLDELDERSQDIIRSRWLQDDKMTLQELANRYEISAERIRQLEANALRKMRASITA